MFPPPFRGDGVGNTFPFGRGNGTEQEAEMDMMEESQAKNKAILEALIKMAFRNSDKQTAPGGEDD